MLFHSFLNCRKMLHLRLLSNQDQKLLENHAELNTFCGSLSESQWMIELTKGLLEKTNRFTKNI